MKIVKAHLKSVSQYSQSRFHNTPKLPKESNDDYAIRTWRNHLHVVDGKVVIPPMALKNCLAEAAKYLGTQIPGKGKSTYTKHFEAGVMVLDPMSLGISPGDVELESLHLPSDGQRGGKKRVIKHYPLIREWEGVATFYITDETITEDVFTEHLEQAGQFIGLGRFRPRMNGFYGRFRVTKVEWDVKVKAA